jgi:cobalt-zinc-cadmium efflux system protein
MKEEHKHNYLVNIEDNNSRKLIVVIVLNFIITIAEVIGGILSNSLALISDSLHNLSDVSAILLSYIAIKISKKAHTLKRTFGYRRIQIIVALFNASVIILVSLFLFKEAYERFINPLPIIGVIMLVVALIGLIANAISVFLLKKGTKDNINIKSAYLHLLIDTLSSIAVVIGGILIFFYNIYWIDPLLTAIIGIYVIREGYSIIKEAYNILMQSTPANIDLIDIKSNLEGIEQVSNLHHVHVWQLDEKNIFFEGHIDLVENFTIKEIEKIQKKIKDILFSKYGINHVTIQAEFDSCHKKELV